MEQSQHGVEFAAIPKEEKRIEPKVNSHMDWRQTKASRRTKKFTPPKKSFFSPQIGHADTTDLPPPPRPNPRTRCPTPPASRSTLTQQITHFRPRKNHKKSRKRRRNGGTGRTWPARRGGEANRPPG
jgi:hypothetical protein